MKGYYTSQEVVKLTGVKYRQLDYWVKLKMVRPSGRDSHRRGVPRLFTFSDMIELRVIKGLLSHGLRPSVIQGCLQALRKDLVTTDKVLSSVRLVTDGNTVFRYLSENDSLISLEEFGQFAFYFELSYEIENLSKAIINTPKRCRYKKRA